MKNVISILISLILMLFPSLEISSADTVTQLACASNNIGEITEIIPANPRLMVTGYELSEKYLIPGETITISISIKNTSKDSSVRNIKLSISDESGDIRTVGMPSDHIEAIKADSEYTWQKEMTAINNAAQDEHKLNVTMEYEDMTGGIYTESETLYIDIKQNIELSFDGASLPSKTLQGENVAVAINLMNTGKAEILNCKAEISIEGFFNAGSVFAGTVPVGEGKSVSAILKTDPEFLGETKGTITIYYEDVYGNKYNQKADIFTVIEEKTDTQASETKTETTAVWDWWIFILIGILPGFILGFLPAWYINDRKKRKDDDLRL